MVLDCFTADRLALEPDVSVKMKNTKLQNCKITIYKIRNTKKRPKGVGSRARWMID